MQTWKYGSRMNTPLSTPSPRGCDRVPIHNRLTNSVAVGNLPVHVHKLEVISLFHSLIGDVQSFRDVWNDSNPRLELTFFDHDTAAKALCMNGYTVNGVPLNVTTVTSHLDENQANKVDDRRNLYVLGLPFALTKSELSRIFAQYGIVSHCVILATVDNSSRRRGFIVMSTHQEARDALSALTRTQIKGHTIDVSWAVVQRSQGFLDGGDRSMVLEARCHVPDSSPRLQAKSSFCHLSHSQGEPDSTLLMTCSMPTTCLLVTNLPTMLFSQAQDLHPLVFPFGQIDKLEIVDVSPLGCLSVIVQYSSASSTRDAKESLHGQLYGSFRIEARYVRLNLEDSNQNMGPRIRSMERRMTDPLDHWSGHTLRRCTSDQVISPLPHGLISAKSPVAISAPGVSLDSLSDLQSGQGSHSDDNLGVPEVMSALQQQVAGLCQTH